MNNMLGNADDPLVLKIAGLIPSGEQTDRVTLLDTVYSALPKDSQAKIQVFTSEILPRGYTDYHIHNGATFFVALQGQFEAHFAEGVLIHATAGDVYSEPIGKVHRGYNPHSTLSYLCIGFLLTSPDREHITTLSAETIDKIRRD